jgi:hypothetical protein
MNLFLYTKSLARGREEDHLTAFFAGALVLDADLRQAYERLVLRAYAQRRGWPEPIIDRVDVQVNLVGYGYPDMVLTLRGGRRVVCEHKLDAVETLAAAEDQEHEPVAQLRRYLAAPETDALVFVRATLKPPDERVLEDPKYIRPADRQHFLWRDFFDLLASSQHAYTKWLCDGFAALGFTPPHPFVGDLANPENMRHFANLWARTRARAHELGWAVGTGAVVELYLNRKTSPFASQVWICPRNEQLLVRVSPVAELTASAIADRFNGVATRAGTAVSIEIHEVRRANGLTPVVDAWAPLRAVLSDAATGEQAEDRLWSFVGPFIEAVS